MPSTISAGLYLKSVQTCDKSKDARSSTLLLRLLGWKMRLLSGSIIFWGQSWTQLHSRKIVDESLGIELHSIFRQTIILYKVSSSMDLERILTKDISPESFKDSSVDSTRHYFGPTRKIYVYSGVLCACPHMGHGNMMAVVYKKEVSIFTTSAIFLYSRDNSKLASLSLHSSLSRTISATGARSQTCIQRSIL